MNTKCPYCNKMYYITNKTQERIIDELRDGKKNIKELAINLGIHRTTLYHHLNPLIKDRVVMSEKFQKKKTGKPRYIYLK